MPLVNRDNTSDPLWGPWPETAPGPTPDVSRPGASSARAESKGAATDVVPQKDDAKPWGDDSRLEMTARATIDALSPNTSVLLTVKAEQKGGDCIGMEADAKVERQKDGSVIVELNGKVDAGLGADLGSARIGVAAGTKFHFKTPAQAADFLDAFAKEGVLVASHLDFAAEAARAFGVKGDLVDARERLLGHLGNISEIKGDLVLTGEVGAKKQLYGFDELSASADLTLKHGFKIDLEKGTFTRSDAIALGGKAKLKLPWVDEAGGAKGTLTANSTWKLTPSELRDLKTGKLSPTDVMNKLDGPPTETSIKCELELTLKASKGVTVDNKGKLSVEYPVDAQKMERLDPRTALNELTRRKWKTELDVGVGVTSGGMLSGKGFSAEVSGSVRRKLKDEGEYDLNSAIAVLQQQLSDADRAQDFVDARRATANLR